MKKTDTDVAAPISTVSKALSDVWEWKASRFHDVEHLPLAEAIHQLLASAQQVGAEWAARQSRQRERD